MLKVSMEEAVKDALGLSVLKATGIHGKGVISSGSAYDSDKYGRIFIKVNNKAVAKRMFEGEYAGLEALSRPNIVRIPTLYKVLDHPEGGALLVMEYLDMSGGLSRYAATLGDQLARLHMHNVSLKKQVTKSAGTVHKVESEVGYIDQFGFHCNTWCGNIEMDNSWCNDWQTFFANKVEMQMKLIEQESGDREARQLWNKVLDRFPAFFEGVVITPALVHGDLWRGNIGEMDTGPVMFDPACFYGHSEFDLSMGYCFGGFSTQFYNAYFEIIPKAPGFEARKELYRMYNYLNHWNHFGEKYRRPSISSLQACINHVYK